MKLATNLSSLIHEEEEFQSIPQPCFCPLEAPDDPKGQDFYYIAMNAKSMLKGINSYEEIILIFLGNDPFNY